MRITPFLALARAGGLYSALRWWHRRELLVLTYHSVVDVPDRIRHRYAPLYRNAVTAPRFEQQMRYLKKHYHLLGQQALYAFLDGDPLPERAAVITFDDGLLNNATVAWPILDRLNIPAFFFLPTAFLDAAARDAMKLHWTEEVTARLLNAPALQAGDWTPVTSTLPGLPLSPASRQESMRQILTYLKHLPPPRREKHLRELYQKLNTSFEPDDMPADAQGHSLFATMTWKQARRLASSNITMGAHTLHHRILTRLPERDARREIQQSLARVTEQTGEPCRLFAYPNGGADDFDRVHQDALNEAGCLGAFTQIAGFNTRATNPLALHRIDVSSNDPLATFQYVSSGTKLMVDQRIRRRRL